MDTLHEEILMKIFSYLSPRELEWGPSRVCIRWNKIIKLKILWIQNSRDLVRLSERTSHITSLVVTTRIDFMNKFLYGLGILCSKLTELTIHNKNQLNEIHVEMIKAFFPSLVHIDVFLSSGFVEPFFIDAVQNVKSLVLNNRILKTQLLAIAGTCVNLCALHMYGYVQFYPVLELNLLLESKRDMLTELSLRCSEVTDKTFMLICNCLNLLQLRLYSCWLITFNGLKHLNRLVKLEILHITGLKLITKTQLSEFLHASKMFELTDLNLSSSSLNNDHAHIISRKFVKLRTLELWKCPNLTEVGLDYIINNLRNLYILDLSMQLSAELMLKVSDNSNIKYLRFCVSSEMKGIVERWNDVQVYHSYARYSGKFFRGSGEGFRANLLFYSLNHIMIKPIKSEKEIKMEDMWE